MEDFYGIVTTTLVVLSSFTLAIFQFLSHASIKKAQDTYNRLSKYTNHNGGFEYECDVAIKYDLSYRYDKLQSRIKPITSQFELEFILLLFIVFLSALAILFVLLYGVYEYNWITTKLIFSIDLIAVVFYMYAFISFVIRWFSRKQKVKKYIDDVDDFFLKIKTEEQVKKKYN